MEKMSRMHEDESICHIHSIQQRIRCKCLYAIVAFESVCNKHRKTPSEEENNSNLCWCRQIKNNSHKLFSIRIASSEFVYLFFMAVLIIPTIL